MFHVEMLRKRHKSPTFASFLSVFGLIFCMLMGLYIIFAYIFLSLWTLQSIGAMILSVVGILFFGTMDWVSYYVRCIVRGIARIEKLFKSDEKEFEPDSMVFYPDYAVMPEGCKVDYTGFQFIIEKDFLCLAFQYPVFKKLIYFIKTSDIPQDESESFMAFLKERGDWRENKLLFW